MTTPQYGMTPQGVAFVQQSDVMSQPYPPYSSTQFTHTPNGQQQQQPMVYHINGQPAPVMFQPVQTKQKPMGAVILSCFTFWLCGILFGLIAFILASKNVVMFQLYLASNIELNLHFNPRSTPVTLSQYSSFRFRLSIIISDSDMSKLIYDLPNVYKQKNSL